MQSNHVRHVKVLKWLDYNDQIEKLSHFPVLGSRTLLQVYHLS